MNRVSFDSNAEAKAAVSSGETPIPDVDIEMTVVLLRSRTWIAIVDRV